MAQRVHLTVATESALKRYLRGMPTGEIMQRTGVAAHYGPEHCGMQHLDNPGLEVKCSAHLSSHSQDWPGVQSAGSERLTTIAAAVELPEGGRTAPQGENEAAGRQRRQLQGA